MFLPQLRNRVERRFYPARRVRSAAQSASGRRTMARARQPCPAVIPAVTAAININRSVSDARSSVSDRAAARPRNKYLRTSYSGIPNATSQSVMHPTFKLLTRQALAVVLTALLAGNCLGRTQSPDRPSPKEQVRAIRTDSPVEVRFLDGSKLRGWISEVSDTGFVLSHEKKGRLEKSQVTFEQVRAVKQVANVKPSHRTRNFLIVTGIGVGLAAAVLAVAYAKIR